MYEHLAEHDIAYLKAHFEWVEGWIEPGHEQDFQSYEGKLTLIQRILDSGEIGQKESVKLQALGNYFGLAICEFTNWQFEVIEDEYGRDLSIKMPGTTAWIHCTSIISKRVETGEDVDVFALFALVIPKLREVGNDERYA